MWEERQKFHRLILSAWIKSCFRTAAFARVSGRAVSGPVSHSAVEAPEPSRMDPLRTDHHSRPGPYSLLCTGRPAMMPACRKPPESVRKLSSPDSLALEGGHSQRLDGLAAWPGTHDRDAGATFNVGSTKRHKSKRKDVPIYQKYYAPETCQSWASHLTITVARRTTPPPARRRTGPIRNPLSTPQRESWRWRACYI